MKNLRILIFLLVALAQLSAPGAMVWKRVHTFRHGRVWKFKTAPVDPVDAIRGRYVSLRYAIEQFPIAEAIKSESNVYVVLKEDVDGFAAVDRISNEPVAGDNVVSAESLGWYDGKARVRFPFNRYWCGEAIAPEAERAYMNNSTLNNQNAYVIIRVRNGDAAIEQLYIDNKPVAEYLREVETKK